MPQDRPLNSRDDAIAHFDGQAKGCANLGSAFLGELLPRVVRGLDPDTATGARLLAWPGDMGADAPALRLAGGLNALARSGAAPDLAAVWPALGAPADPSDPASPTPETQAKAALAAIAAHDATVNAWLDGAPQTNEVRRSAALLGGLCALGWDRVELLEIGASAGLSLGIDGYRYDLGEGRTWGPEGSAVRIATQWRGAAPALRPFAVEARAGCDIAPIDARDPEQRERMLAYIWPDQPARRAMLEAALDHIAAHGPQPEAADAAEWAARRLAAPQPEGSGRLLWHSIMKQYLPAETRADLDAAVAEAGARATARQPFALLSMEADGRSGSAAVTLASWPGGETREIARTSFHGYWTDWTL